MVSHELAIEQFEPAHLQPCDEPRQSNLRCVGFTRKHAFAEKRASQAQPVQPAYQATSRPAFDAVGMPFFMQAAECLFNIRINPSVPSARLRFGTSGNDLRKRGIGGNHKPVLPDGFGKRL
jgi:hypothetical protein